MNLSEEKKTKKEEVILSMTSFPGAIDYSPKAIKSLLNGTLLPDKFVLYLTFSQFPDRKIPDEILKLSEENPVFEIRDYPYDIRSYRKLIPALEDFPEAIIVTVDDDVFYKKTMLERLLKAHIKNPRKIITHRPKRIKPEAPYKKWKKLRWYHFLFKRYENDPLILPTGVAGVLYPPNSLNTEMLNKDLFTHLAPTTDDIWFWAAGIAQGCTFMPVPFGQNKPKSVGKPKSLSLKWLNYKGGEDRNFMAFQNILKHFPVVKEKISLK